MSVGAALLAATGVQVAANIQAMRVAQAEAKAQEELAEYNAAVAGQQAEARRLKGEFDQRQVVAAGRRRYGTALSRMGASGALPSDLVLEAIAGETEKERGLTEYETMTDIAQIKSQAAIFEMKAAYAKMRGKAAGTAGLLAAGGAAMGGYTDIRRAGYTLGGIGEEITGYGRSLLTGFS
jgi:hypothetical protein